MEKEPKKRIIIILENHGDQCDMPGFVVPLFEEFEKRHSGTTKITVENEKLPEEGVFGNLQYNYDLYHKKETEYFHKHQTPRASCGFKLKKEDFPVSILDAEKILTEKNCIAIDSRGKNEDIYTRNQKMSDKAINLIKNKDINTLEITIGADHCLTENLNKKQKTFYRLLLENEYIKKNVEVTVVYPVRYKTVKEGLEENKIYNNQHLPASFSPESVEGFDSYARNIIHPLLFCFFGSEKDQGKNVSIFYEDLLSGKIKTPSPDEIAKFIRENKKTPQIYDNNFSEVLIEYSLKKFYSKTSNSL